MSSQKIALSVGAHSRYHGRMVCSPHRHRILRSHSRLRRRTGHLDGTRVGPRTRSAAARRARHLLSPRHRSQSHYHSNTTFITLHPSVSPRRNMSTDQARLAHGTDHVHCMVARSCANSHPTQQVTHSTLTRGTGSPCEASRGGLRDIGGAIANTDVSQKQARQGGFGSGMHTGSGMWAGRLTDNVGLRDNELVARARGRARERAAVDGGRERR